MKIKGNRKPQRCSLWGFRLLSDMDNFYLLAYRIIAYVFSDCNIPEKSPAGITRRRNRSKINLLPADHKGNYGCNRLCDPECVPYPGSAEYPA